MADAPVVHIGENSPEEVAFKLYREVVNYQELGRLQGADKKKAILDLFAECLIAVRQPHRRLEKD